MAAEFKISRLRFNYLGQWAPNTFYNRDAIVTYHGKTYVCLQPHTSALNDSAFYDALHYYTPGGAPQPRWELVIGGHEWVGTWRTNTYYNLGNIVTYGGALYLCVQEHTSGSVIDLNNFQIYCTFSNWHTQWDVNHAYGIGDVVKYGGIVYICNYNHVSASTPSLGLEANQSYWDIVVSGIEYKGAWNGVAYRYKKNDIVKEGPDLWICGAGHTSSNTFDQTKWTVWMPGIEYAGTWSSSAIYQPGDVVKYGGYSYYSLTANNTNNVPSLDGIDWQLLTTGYEMMGEWTISTPYKVGDVVRRHGSSFAAIQDNTGKDPSAKTVSVSKQAPFYSWNVSNFSGAIIQGPMVSPGVFASVMTFTVPSQLQAVVNAWTGSTILTITINGSTTHTYTLAAPLSGSYTALFNETYGTYGTVTAITFTGVDTGTQLTVQSTAGIVPGMLVKGIGFSLGQTVVKVLDSTTLQLNVPPDGSVQAAQALTFDGINYTYWQFIAPGTKWQGFWSSAAVYTIGDLVIWKNSTYKCVQNHDTNTTSMTSRPDNDTMNLFWIEFAAHDRFNALAEQGDIPSYSNGSPAALTIGTTDQVLRATQSTELTPSWKQILVTPKVYYVATNGEDRADYGITWDRPWKTIKYAADYVNKGTAYQGARNTLIDNKDWLLAEMYQWMLYQKANNVAPFTTNSVFGQAKTLRDASYVIDALVYDVSRVGNSQTVAATLAYFKPDGSDSFFNDNVTAQMPYFIAGLTKLKDLIDNYVMYGTAPDTSYQALMNVPVNKRIAFTNQNSAEVGARAEVASLSALVIDALTNETTSNLPAPNQGISSTIFVKTGTYSEKLPILVPAQCAIVGDELRGVVVQPKLVINTFATRTTDTNVVTVYTTEGLYDQCPIQFVKSSNFITNLNPFEDNIVAGQTYYVIGSSITSNSFKFSSTPGGNPVTLVGDVGFIQLIGGDALSDMFHLRNASGLRNLTLTGLLGTLTPLNQYLTQRPTGGAYCAFDPGKGPDDTVAWIQKRSPYCQNVTMFGQGCIAMKVDGDLHNGGNRSMTANDFTCIISDGIGCWTKGSESKTELISVFTYYCYASYFAEAGGRIRAANGNSSYGAYGTIAEGYDVNESPITGKINNQAGQAKASVQQAFGVDANLLKIQYSNAGIEYNQNTTNLLSYSNNFIGTGWNTDGNVVLSQNLISPSTYNDGWTFNGLTSNSDSAYVYKNISITPTGATYTGLSGSNVTGAGSGAAFDVVVNATTYTVTVAIGNDGGSGYVFGNQITIYGSQVGGIDGINDITLTVSQLVGSKIVAVTNTGTVPAGSALQYTMSIYAKKGSAKAFDLYGIYSGTSPRTSYVRFTFDTASLTVGNGGDGGLTPTQYGVQSLTDGWYRIWMSIYDTNALNNNLQFRVYPRSSNGFAGYTYFYGSQVEIGTSPNFYLTTTTGLYSAYADYIVNGAGVGAVIVADETRSQSIYESRITDPGSGAGGSGYLTASNNAQGGNEQYITLSGADINTSANYNGMRVFINSGTGAGQFGYISSYDANSKIAYVLKESLVALPITYADTSDDTFWLSDLADVNSLYVGQPVQFIPTYYSTTVSATSQTSIVITSTVGGTTNVVTTDSTAGLYYNMAVTFSGSIPATCGLVANYTYYIYDILDANRFKLASTPFGNAITLTSATPNGTMYMNIPSNSSYLTAASTASMTANMPIQFTGVTLGGITPGDVYYINDVVDANNFTISIALLTGTVTATTDTNSRLTVSSTSTLVPLNPIVFSEPAIGTLQANTKYYISKISNSTQFTVSSSLLVVGVTATEFGSNLITCSSTSGFVVDQPIKFTGNSFGGLTAETTYYILAINNSTTFTVATAVGASSPALTTATGSMTARTCPAPDSVVADTGAMTYKTTPAKFTLSTSTGSMNAIFSTPIFGGINGGQTYYIKTIQPGTPNKFTIEATLNSGTTVNLISGTGTMQMGEVGWDHVNPGTLIEPALDSTSLYYIEPRLTYSAPGFSQTASTLTSVSLTNYYAGVAYGNNYWIAVPNGGTTISGSTDGVTWEGLTLPTTPAAWSAIAYGNTAWVITSSDDSKKVLYSFSKGQSWKASTMPSPSPWSSIAYANGTFVAVAQGKAYAGVSGTNLVGSGSSATFNVTAVGSGYTVTVANGGTGYVVNDTIKILGTALGGATPANDATITVQSVGVFTPGIVTASITGTSASVGTAAYSTSYGSSWTAATLPGTQNTWTSVAAGGNKFVAVSSGTTASAYSTDNGATWTASTLPDNGNWSSIAYGNGRFVAVQNGRSFAAQGGTNISGTGSGATFTVSTSGSNYLVSIAAIGSGYSIGNQIKILGTALGGATPANDLTITVSALNTGNPTGSPTGITGITSAGTAKVTYPVYSLDGINWTKSSYSLDASTVAYGNGVFLALKSGSTIAYTSEDGLLWTKRTVTNDAYRDVVFGFASGSNIGAFVTVAGSNLGSKVFAGATTKGRPIISDGIVTAVTEFETGSNYSTLPTVSIFDPNVTTVATITPRSGNGVLSAPSFINRGAGYNTSSTALTINGSGYADQYQTGLTIIVKNLTQLPRPGDDLTITGISEIYKVTNASVLNGTTQPNITASIQISPSMSVANSPNHNTTLIIREKYSQVRLTNHDFLNVGYGDQPQSGYPGFPIETTLQAQNQTIENNYGRVFYTSTDQDGNFKVGNLFGVEQATGIVTLSASQFGLSGLSQLSLGGIAVGGSSVVVTQFSTDSTFVANSDAILPTQKAIKSYLTARLSQGGSNTFTGQTTAGQVVIGGPNVINNTIPQGTQGSSVQMLNKVNVFGADSGLVDGGMMAFDFFMKNSARRG